jgi:hypothetical protein
MLPRSCRKVLVVATLLTAGAAFLPADIFPFGSSAVGCPFCTAQGQTLTNDAAQASMILYGRLTNARLDPKDFNAGSTDLIIEEVVKPHEILGDKKQVTLPRYLPQEKENQYKYLVFCDVFKGALDPYRGVAVKPDSRIAEYLKGALAVKDKDAATRLKYFLDYLDDSDVEVSNDAYMEFGNADYKDYRPVAEKAPADKLAKWLTDANTPPSRLGLYGSMLGHCGKAEHGKLLRDLLDDPQRQYTSGIDGILAGLVLLQPKEGWKYLTDLVNDPKKDFLLRYAGLRAARFFHEFRPDVVPVKQVIPAVCSLLDQKDIADLAVEDLRKWSQWDVADRVLDLFANPTHDVPIIRRAVIKYALTHPKGTSKRVDDFVAARRKENAALVDDLEELLRMEAPPKPAAPATPGPAKK